MRILVTGATGFIGAHLALSQQRTGREIRATGRLQTDDEAERAGRLRDAGVQLVGGSLHDPAFVASVVQGCDAVLHLAAAQHEANVPDRYFEDTNVGGTRALIEAAIDAGVRRFVYGSTIGVYGAARDGALSEESPPAPDNIYGRTKLAAEGVTRAAGDRIETCVIRISETYGGGDRRLLKLFRAIDRGLFIMIGPGDNLRQVIHVDDLVNGLLLAVEHPAAAGGTFVLAGEELMTTREMVRTIAESLGRKRPQLRVPMWPFVGAAAVLETACRPLGIQPPLHRRRLDFFRKSFVLSADRAKRQLGFRPSIGFAEGAREAAAWYRSKGWL
jgi:dihydroflavonol-4-reductase